MCYLKNKYFKEIHVVFQVTHLSHVDTCKHYEYEGIPLKVGINLCN